MSTDSLTNRLMAGLLRAHAKRVLDRFLLDARRADETQHRLLLSLIRQNARSAFGKTHGFSTIRTYDDFKRQLPISIYADLAPWIDRVRAGETNAMFGGGQRIRMFAMTSGTVDAPKYIPVTDRFLDDQRAGWHAFGIKALTDHPECFRRKILQVTSPMDEERTERGVPCGAITGLMAATQKKLVRGYYVAPLPVAHISDLDARRYTVMRMAMPADVSWIVTASPATVLQLARTGQRHAESIIRDVRDGTISKDFAIPRHVRDALAPRLHSDPESADRLEKLHELHGRLLPKHYWNIGFLANWTGGTMGLYLQDYPDYFGSVPTRDIGLIATEGRMSIPLTDGTPAGVAAVSTVFFEFIPAAEYGSASPTTLRAHEVQSGEEYFILLTNSAGLYRYDICDCVRVVGFEGKAPLIEFLHKGAHVSSMTGEKLTERQVILAAEHINASGESMGEFVLAPRWADPPYYRLYVEERAGVPSDWAERLANSFDECLSRINCEYASKRSSDRLGDLRLCVVAPAAIAALDRQRALRFRKNNEQFKHQFLLASPNDDDALATCTRRDVPASAHRSETIGPAIAIGGSASY